MTTMMMTTPSDSRTIRVMMLARLLPLLLDSVHISYQQIPFFGFEHFQSVNSVVTYPVIYSLILHYSLVNALKWPSGVILSFHQ